MEDAKKYIQANPGTTITFAAKLFNVSRSTLSRQYRGVTVPREQYLRNIDRKLTEKQEMKLVKHINTLTLRGNAPTYPMVRRYAEEISKKSMGKNWPGKFVQRQSKHLDRGFLDAIEISRKKADSAKRYQRWFDQVIILF